MALAASSAALTQTSKGAAQVHEPFQNNGADPDDASTILVTGRRHSLRKALDSTVAETDQGQIARYERDLCVKVVGLPSDWATIVTRMINLNVEFAGRRVAGPGCVVNALAIFIDRPDHFLRGLRKKDPSFFDMSPREFENFARVVRPAYSWQVVDSYGSRGQRLRSLSTLTYQDPTTGAIITTPLQNGTKVAQDETGSRLVSGFREEIEISFVTIDRSQIEGRTLRQLADFSTLHLMMAIKPTAAAAAQSSILSLFESRTEGGTPPARMTQFDRGVLRGLYAQPFNNRSASQQRQNIARAIEKGAGDAGE